MGRIDDIPGDVTHAGQDLDYPNPPALVSIVLVNAPLDPAHQNIGLNQAAYDDFIAAEVTAGRAYTNDEFVLYDPEHPLVIPLTYDQAAPYNYGRLTIDSRNWYVFYTAKYLNAANTRMMPDIDEWASYPNMQLGYSTIERGHVGVAVSQGDTYGDQYLTTPEPIEAPPVNGLYAASVLPNSIDDYTVLVISANNLRGNGTETPYFQHHFNEFNIGQAAGFATDATDDVAGSPQITIGEAAYPWLATSGGGGTFQLYVPHVTPAPASTIDGVPAGGGVYLFTPGGYLTWLAVMQGAPWIADGIVDIRLVPTWAVPGGGSTGATVLLPPTTPLDASWAIAADIPAYVGTVVSTTVEGTQLDGWRDELLALFGAGEYRKILTAPYTDIMIGNGSGAQHLRPDQMLSDGIGLAAATGAAHGEMSAHVRPVYNNLGSQYGLDVGVGGAAGLVTSGYGRGAANTASADMGPWQSAYASFTGRQVLLNQQALAQSLAITGVQMSMGVQGIQTVMNATGAAASGNFGGALADAGNYAVAGIAANNSLEILDISQDGSMDIASYQFGLSGEASLLTFDAWAQSLRAISGSGRAEQLASAWRTLLEQAIDVIIVIPSVERVYACLSIWRRYGYMIERAFTPGRLDVMSHFSYWKTSEATILGSAPQAEKQTIAEAFNQGLTVWNDISEIGSDQTGNNEPVTGSYY